MEHLKMHSPNFTDANIARVAELFPNCVTEATDESGSLTRAIDFDQLRQELSNHIVEGPRERYQLNWPGKREALLTANAPIAKTLRPCREESVNFDTTENLFIEGDNLDALKLLQETYLGKVKMIYIDPPYNTGNDFIYSDNFAESTDDFLKGSGQRDEEGNRLVANTESNGRFHSDWLSMMYSRLKLARNLLRDDGVIFISIDDGEVANLRKLGDEVFGENQFAAQIIWKKRNTPPNDKVIGTQHDYILVYVKTSLDGINLRRRSDDQIARYKNPDNHPKGPWVAGDLSANVKGGRYVESLNYTIKNPRTGQEFSPPNNGNWRFNSERMQRHIDADEIYFGQEDKSSPKFKRFLSEVKSGTTWTTLWDFAPLNTSGSKEMKDIFGNSVLFESPKPVGLIKHIVSAGSDTDSIIVDFFSGSATTAHAVMQLNAEDGGKRKFIMVQLPEACDEKSEAFKAGYKSIAEISKERIRRAGKKILEGLTTEGTENHGKSSEDLFNSPSVPSVSSVVDKKGLTTEGTEKHGKDLSNSPSVVDTLDIGFRVLKVDSSNMQDVYYTPDATKQAELFDLVDNIKPDRAPEDLLFQVLLDWGVDLTLPISKEIIKVIKDERVSSPDLKLSLFFCISLLLFCCFGPRGERSESWVSLLTPLGGS
ncbi:MAG: site-specific DNA-methyltransferase, partial [Kiritimatiellae bacterium]|nr:site-specific DNA-methyltransferase [Kiritimatiellia bacterium]